MATISQIKGALLEEAILKLLEQSGYKCVNPRPNINKHDPYLDNATNYSICVLGRGENHQIDAIADYAITPPFTNPLRLLCEAKYRLNTPVGIEIIRNAVGVRKDVDEYFRPSGSKNEYRHHYQYVVVSSTGFTANAQKYAFAQDIYLLDLNSKIYKETILDIIDSFVDGLINRYSEESEQEINWRTNIDINLSHLRKLYRGLRD